MQDNLLTHAQFPNPQAWEYFREWLTNNTMEHIQHANKGVLIARDPATGDVASFVKWLEYGPGGEVSLFPPTANATTTEDEWPEFCGRDILDEYTVIAAEARKRILKEKGYFRKFLSLFFRFWCPLLFVSLSTECMSIKLHNSYYTPLPFLMLIFFSFFFAHTTCQLS